MSRAIIDGVLYDTDKCEYVMDTYIAPDGYPRELPGKLYRGKNRWFVVVMNNIYPVTEFWVKNSIGRKSIEKYIELFGKVEDA